MSINDNSTGPFRNHTTAIDYLQHIVQIAVFRVNCHCTFSSSNIIAYSKVVCQNTFLVHLLDWTNEMMILLCFLIQDKSKFGSKELPVERLYIRFLSFEVFFGPFPYSFNLIVVSTAIFPLPSSLPMGPVSFPPQILLLLGPSIIILHRYRRLFRLFLCHLTLIVLLPAFNWIYSSGVRNIHTRTHHNSQGHLYGIHALEILRVFQGELLCMDCCFGDYFIFTETHRQQLVFLQLLDQIGWLFGSDKLLCSTEYNRRPGILLTLWGTE